MNRAYEEARKSTPEFVSALRTSANKEFRYLAKVKVEADGEVEYVWLEPITLEGESISGPVINDFARITSFKKGDVRHVQIDRIYDWAILDQNNNVMRGGFTLKVMKENEGGKP